MSKKDRHLPKPPSSPLGSKKYSEKNADKESLISDEMAMAAAAGKLDEFLKKKFPDQEYAKKLAEIMMGMTGMPASSGHPEANRASKKKIASARENSGEEPPASPEPPEDVINAIQNADVKRLMDLLKREQKKRSGVTEKKEQTAYTTPREKAKIEKAIIDDLIRIASDNDLSLDWLIFRALKRYVDEYKKTGNL